MVILTTVVGRGPSLDSVRAVIYIIIIYFIYILYFWSNLKAWRIACGNLQLQEA